MRRTIVHEGAGELSYEIREIVVFGEQLKKAGKEIIWENIGDPVAKGEKIPAWIKKIIQDTLANDDLAFAYSPTRGLLETREFIAKMRNAEGGAQITANDILFFNGLGDAVSKVYNYLHSGVRIIGPSPAYPTHSSAEAAHAGSRHLTYALDPMKNWLPDLEDLRNKVKYNESIGGILIINPDNPTGMIYPKVILEGIVAIAREFDLFIISDEIYSSLHYGNEAFCPLASVIGDVPGIAMRGLSKEIPWPGARCGWIECYNTNKDEQFARYTKSLVDAKMLEVCSTTLPQKVLPKIFTHPEYKEYLAGRRAFYKKRADEAHAVLSKIPHVRVVKPAGAFYVTVVFEEGVLKAGQTLSIEEKGVEDIVMKTLKKTDALDKRFAYYLMAHNGLCVVPLSGFNTNLFGFRMTLLERDDPTFSKTLALLKDAIPLYIKSV